MLSFSYGHCITDSDYPFDIFKLFFQYKTAFRKVNINYWYNHIENLKKNREFTNCDINENDSTYNNTCIWINEKDK